MDTAVSPGTDFFPPEFCRLLRTAQQEIDRHVNAAGTCAGCSSPWPCQRAFLAELNLAEL